MKFERYSFKKKSPQDMIAQSNELKREMLKRRSIRDFSSKEIPDMVIENVLKTALAAPSGANKQPWKFVVVKNKNIKKKIRIAAEVEEKKFYKQRATEEWLKDLNKFGTDWNKPFLENAPALIIVFRQSYDNGGKEKRKNTSPPVDTQSFQIFLREVHARHAAAYHEEHEKSKEHCAEQVQSLIELTGRAEEMLARRLPIAEFLRSERCKRMQIV